MASKRHAPATRGSCSSPPTRLSSRREARSISWHLRTREASRMQRTAKDPRQSAEFPVESRPPPLLTARKAHLHPSNAYSTSQTELGNDSRCFVNYLERVNPLDVGSLFHTPWTAGWSTVRGAMGSADFQSAVSQVSNLLECEPIPKAGFHVGALPIGNRRYSRLEICATKMCRPSHSLLSILTIRAGACRFASACQHRKLNRRHL